MANKSAEWLRATPPFADNMFGGAGAINNSYNCTIGSVLAFYLGQGRVTNVFGSETKIVFDWQYVLKNTGYPKVDFGIGLLLQRWPNTGGDSTFVLGPSHKLNYFGTDFSVNRARVTLKANYAPDLLAKTTESPEWNSIPGWIQVWIFLGFSGILSLVLCLRRYYKLNTVQTTNAGYMASFLIPALEAAWLGILVTIEQLGAVVDCFLTSDATRLWCTARDEAAAAVDAAKILAAEQAVQTTAAAAELAQATADRLLQLQAKVVGLENCIRQDMEHNKKSMSEYLYSFWK